MGMGRRWPGLDHHRLCAICTDAAQWREARRQEISGPGGIQADDDRPYRPARERQSTTTSYFPGDGFGYGYGLAVRTDPGNAKPPPAGSIGELKWDSGSGTYLGVDPKLGMVYILMEQTQTERGRILPIFKKLVYDAFRQ